MGRETLLSETRLYDLVRYARHYLHDDGLITDEEFADLVGTGSESARRLEGYDALRKRVEEAELARDAAESRKSQAFQDLRERAEKAEAERDSYRERYDALWNSDALADVRKLQADLDAVLTLLRSCLDSTGIRRSRSTDAAWERVEPLLEARNGK